MLVFVLRTFWHCEGEGYGTENCRKEIRVAKEVVVHR
jgi:uncharacterized protein YdaU (DUF1376 family)